PDHRLDRRSKTYAGDQRVDSAGGRLVRRIDIQQRVRRLGRQRQLSTGVCEEVIDQVYDPILALIRATGEHALEMRKCARAKEILPYRLGHSQRSVSALRLGAPSRR